MSNNKKDSSDNINGWIIYFLWPFLSFLYAFKNYEKPNAKNIVWFFTIFFAVTMVISDLYMDANRYKDFFLQETNISDTFSNLFDRLYSPGSYYLDVLSPILRFIIAKFTDEYKVYFAILGLIFGYFYSRNIWIVIENGGGKITKYNLLIIIAFAMIIGFWQINNFRFWTAAHIFFYGTAKFFIENRKYGILIALTSALVHFSFLFPVLVLLIYLIAGNRSKIYFYFFIVSFFINEINLLFVQQNLMALPTVFHDVIIGYTRESYYLDIREQITQMNWYARWYERLFSYSLTAFIIYIYLKQKYYLNFNPKLKNIFSFSILFYGFANIATLVPSGWRFVVLGNLFLTAIIILVLQKASGDKILKRLKIITAPAFFVFIIVTLRISTDFIGVFTLIGNWFLIPFQGEGKALIEMIK